MRYKILKLLIIFTLWIPMEASGHEMRDLHVSMKQQFERHHYKQVIALYEDFRDKKPDRMIPLAIQVLHAQAQAQTGDLEGATLSIQKILPELPPELDYIRLNYDLANLLSMQGKTEGAMAAYHRMLRRAEDDQDSLRKARERIARFQGKGSKRKNEISLQLLDIETSLEGGQIPDGAGEILQNIQSQKTDVDLALKAQRISEKLKEVENEKATALLDRARRLFDQERKYGEVLEVLEQITLDYPEMNDRQSVEALAKEARRRLGTSPRPSP